ncbi:dermonecrotic toxin domain-containing protein [Pseudomonas putida]|uniref:dermonecrotic toxin domain-containing protein n=1 Tax=Pseudomonas putida TaxID=303 RepID=UPI00383AA6AA
MTLDLSSTTQQTLSTLRTRIDQRLGQHPSLESMGLANLDQTLTDAEVASIELTIRSAAHTYWESLEKPSLTRRQCHIEDIETTLRQLLDIQIAAGRIHPTYATCLPASLDQNDLTVSTLSLKIEAGRAATLHGCLMFSLDSGPTLVWLAGRQWAAFATRNLALAALTALVNQPMARASITDTLTRAQRLAMNQASAVQTYEQRHWVIKPAQRKAFAELHRQLRSLQLHDIKHALHTVPAPGDARSGRVEDALRLPLALGPGSALDTTLDEARKTPPKAPDWLRYAPEDQANQCLKAFQEYDHARDAMLSALGGCDSIESFAATHLRSSIANDLGLDLDPEQITLVTKRTLPQTAAPYEIRRSLVHLALQGLHDGDDQPASEFIAATRFEQQDRPLPDAYATLTPAYVCKLIETLALHGKFAPAQIAAHKQDTNRSLMNTALLQQIAAQAWCARLQGQIKPEDQQTLATFAAGSGTGYDRLSSANLLLADQYLLSDALLVRQEDAEGVLQRLLLCCPHHPHKPVLGFDSERQLLIEVVGWFAAADTQAYLLQNVVAQQRTSFAALIKKIADKPFPQTQKQPVSTGTQVWATWYLDIRKQRQHIPTPEKPYKEFMTLVRFTGQEGVSALTHNRIEVAEANTAAREPAWLQAASASQRGQLTRLEDQVQAAMQQYAKAGHAQLPDFEAYVHAQAKDKLRQLLGRRDDSVDPNSVLIKSPRETLTYTQMLRNGYDDSLGLFTATADTTATFEGPAGLDLSALTPQSVTGSVRGQWVSDRYVRLIEETLLSPIHTGYAWRRRQSVLIVQLQMQLAALRSLLQGHLDARQHTWVLASIQSMHRTADTERERHAFYRLVVRIDNEFLASEPTIGRLFNALYRVMGKTPPYREEIIHGCYLLKSPAGQPAQTLLYTPAAADGIDFRPFNSFVQSLDTPGMADYYKDRSRRQAGQLLAFLFKDLREGGSSPVPSVPESPTDDLRILCYDDGLRQRIVDVRDVTKGRADMIASIVWNTLETAAQIVTLPFPPAAFAVGAALALRDYIAALSAFINRDTGTASLYLLSSLLNGAGAYGDLAHGMKGFGGLLRNAERLPSQPRRWADTKKAVLGLTERELKPVELKGQSVLLGPPSAQGLARIARRNASGELIDTGRYARQDKMGGWTPVQSADNAVVPPAADKHAVAISLEGGTPASGTHAQGITLVKSRPYVQIDAQVFQVQFDPHTTQWSIIDPDNPFAFFGRQPLARQADGTWKRIDNGGLRGGSPGDNGLVPTPETVPPPVAGGDNVVSLPSARSSFWDTHMKQDAAQSERLSNQAQARHRALLDDTDIARLEDGEDAHIDEHDFQCLETDEGITYTYKEGEEYLNRLVGDYTDENSQVNSYLRRGVHEFPFCDSDTFVDKLVDSLETLPKSNTVALYRGGNGSRSTSGEHFRSGKLKKGDVLVNSDLTSFTENPYVIRAFASDELSSPDIVTGTFDDTSVVFEVPAGQYESGVPIAPLSGTVTEAETLFPPGCRFEIEDIGEVVGDDFRFVNVKLKEIPSTTPVVHPVYDLRTGNPFKRDEYAAMLKNDNLVERFFPAIAWTPPRPLNT